jgi:ferric-dicitrate binding protein FerR (iron transport regulator)
MPPNEPLDQPDSGQAPAPARGGSMGEVIVRWLQGQATPGEEESLREWRRSSPTRDQYCRDLERTWQVTAAPPHHDESPASIPPSAASIIARANATRRPPSARSLRPPRLRVWLSWGALAAAAVIAGFLGLRVVRQRATDATYAAQPLATGPSGLTTVSLLDGTVVRLGPNSTLRVARDPAARVVFLTGRAFFAVAHRDGAAFRVRTDAGEVVVTGTRFAVEAKGRSMRTMVLQGTVAAVAGGHRALVHAGQAGQVTDGDSPQVGEIGDAFGDIDAWVGDLISFEATPLDEVALELGRHYRTHVTLTDAALAQRTVTASFTGWTLPAVLASICEVADVSCTSGPNGVTIAPRDSSAGPAPAGGVSHSRRQHRQPS